MAPTVRLLAAAAALAAALAQSPSPPPGAPACASSPPTAVRVASASDGALVLSWGPPAGGTPATAFLVTLTPVPGGTPAPPFNRPEWGVCAAPRALARLLGGDARGAAFRALVTGTAYTAVVTAQFACGALDAPAPGVSATIAPASLPTPDAPTFWLDAESFPRLPAATLLGGAPIADVTGSWFMRTWKSNAGTPPTTVKLSPRAGGRYARGLVFTGNAYDVLVPNTTAGAGTGATAIASAADNAAFGFRTDADNTLTVFAAWQGGGGFVVSKGGYPYFGDAGWVRRGARD